MNISERVIKYLVPILNIGLVALCSYILVGMAYDLLKVKLAQFTTVEIRKPERLEGPPKKMGISDYLVAAEKKAFGEPPPVESKEGKASAPEPTTLKLKLQGTIVGDKEGFGAVIYDMNTKKQGIYKIGDKVQGATIASVERGKVILKVGEKEQILAFEEPKKASTPQAPAQAQAPPPTEPKAKQVTIQRAEIDASMQDLPKLMSQVNLAPHFKDGQPAGIAIHRINPGSIFQKLGLNNGDILVGVERNPIKSPEDLINLYDKLKNAESVTVQVERGGAMVDLEYEIK